MARIQRRSQRSDVAAQVAISLRLSRKTRDIIDRAAECAGRSRSDFMVSAAKNEAENMLIDQQVFTLDAKSFTRFRALLDEPPQTNERLQKLLALSPPWKE